LAVFFSGFPFFPADPFGFVRFLLVLFLAIRAVYHRHMRTRQASAGRAWPMPVNECNRELVLKKSPSWCLRGKQQ
jgi:hypothetical protein